jgi:hypothetical protein
MKQITITVADDIVGTIVGLVADYVTEMHVTTPEGPKRRSPSVVGNNLVNKNRKLSSETDSGKFFLSLLPKDGTMYLMAAVEDAFIAAGYKRGTAGACRSLLKNEGKVIRPSRDYVALCIGNPDVG